MDTNSSRETIIQEIANVIDSDICRVNILSFVCDRLGRREIASDVFIASTVTYAVLT